LNNNRGNNRRRGRGNNNRPQNGGQQINRIDSRARGNAPQMLEKYRKMAQDAHLNGDRVQAEYYLQFADHYFRVVADTRVRQEEQRLRQNGGQAFGQQPYPGGGSVSGDNWQDADGEDDSMEFGIDRDFPTFERAPQPRREDREPRQDRDQRDYREPRPEREPRQDREPRVRTPEPVAADAVPPEGLRVVEGEPITAATDNPFVRDARGQRGRNNDRRGGRRPDSDALRPQRNFAEAPAEPAEPAPRFDPASLPPAIGPRSDPVDEAPPRAERPRTLRAATAAPVAPPAPAPVEAVAADVPAPKKRGRPRKNPLPVDEG
jgi:hypothetical protein